MEESVTTNPKFRELLKDAKKKTVGFLSVLPNDIKVERVPTTGGVYKFQRKSRALYIGKAVNLRRRLRDHLSAEIQDTTSAFRRSIHTNPELGIAYGKEMHNWILKNCRYSFYEIDSADMRALVEALTITFKRHPGLLNK